MSRRLLCVVLCVEVVLASFFVLPPSPLEGRSEDGIQPLAFHMSVTNASAVTIYEWDFYLNMRTFPVSEVLVGTASFITEFNETITLWSDGEYLMINCSRPYVDGEGCNLGGAQLNGIPGYPPGIWP